MLHFLRGVVVKRMMRVSAEQYLHYAVSTSHRLSDSDNGELDTSGLRSSEMPQSWPGRMSTARDLLKKRAAVKRKREAAAAEGSSEAKEEVGGGPSDASSSEADEFISVSVSDEVQGDGEQPSAKTARSADGQHQVLVVASDRRAHWKRRYAVPQPHWQPAATQHSKNPFVQATAATHPHLKQRRRPHSIISGDGFSLVEEVFAVPPLTVLCLQRMQQDLQLLGGDTVGLLPQALRHSLVYSTAAARKLDSSTCQVFAPLRAARGDLPCDEEGGAPVSVEDSLELPDCSAIDDATLRETLCLCGGHLYSLHLRHCGRCLTDRTVHWLTGTGSGTLAELQGSAPGRVFASLRRIHLEGAYSLSNVGLRALLQAATNVATLALHASPDIDGGALHDLSSLAPSLQSLTLSACHKVGDVALGVKYALQAAAATGTSSSAAASHSNSGGETFKLTDDEVTPTDAMLLPYQSTHKAQAPYPTGCGLRHASPPAGLIAATNIVHLELSHLPNVTDALFDSLVAAAGGSLNLQSLVLRQMPGITNHAMHVLGGRSTPRSGAWSATAPAVKALASEELPPAAAHLSVLVLDTLPNVSDTGLRSIARCLKGNALRLGVINMQSVKKEPSLLRLLRAGIGQGQVVATGEGGPGEEQGGGKAPSPAGISGITGELSGSMAAMLAALSGAGAGADSPSCADENEGGDGGGRSSGALARLQLSGVACLTDATLSFLAHSSCVLSLRHLDLSWCRGVTDVGVGMLADACERLLTLRVWGNTQLTNELYTRLVSAKKGSSGDEVSTLYVEGRPGDKLPPPEYELPARAGGSEAHLYEVSALP